MRGVVQFIARSARCESGAVTIDWIVLAAGLVVLALVSVGALDGGLTGLIADMNGALVDAGLR